MTPALLLKAYASEVYIADVSELYLKSVILPLDKENIQLITEYLNSTNLLSRLLSDSSFKNLESISFYMPKMVSIWEDLSDFTDEEDLTIETAAVLGVYNTEKEKFTVDTLTDLFNSDEFSQYTYGYVSQEFLQQAAIGLHSCWDAHAQIQETGDRTEKYCSELLFKQYVSGVIFSTPTISEVDWLKIFQNL